MAHNLITLSMLANVACAVGIDMGFNCAEAQRCLDPLTLEPLISITFGDYKYMSKPRMRAPQEWAMGYDSDSPCFRMPKTLAIPNAALAWSVDAVKKLLQGGLLELVPSGPSGVKTDLELCNGT